jgi:hypothetical protein
MPQYRIRLYADAQGMHHQQLFAGLCELDRGGLAAVEYVDLTDVPSGPGSTLWMEAEFGRCSKKICYDMHDSHPVVALERLQRSDVYFKRSFNTRTRVGLAEQDSIKLRPLGLNVHAVGHRDRGALQRLALESRIRRSRSHPLTREEWSYRLVALLSSYRPLVAPAWARNWLIAKAQDLEAPPQSSLTGTVFFQTRLWSRDVAPKESRLDELNNRRAQLVRALREAFGSRFRGGLIPTPLAKKAHPDCISDLPTTQAAYLEEVKQAQIGVVTRGLHGSVPWKLAENLAASRCVVSESWSVSLPPPLESGTNLLWFERVEGCLASIDHLLSQPRAAADMQRANADYYERYVRPSALVLNTLNCIHG